MKAKKRCADTAYKIRLLRIMSLYAVAMLIILIFSITMFYRTETSELYVEVTETVTDKEYVYVQADTQTGDSGDTDALKNSEKYTVKEYMDKIGIFSEDGTLIDVLDVYVKTLPEADKRLLGEGIEIVGKRALNAIIEDYSS